MRLTIIRDDNLFSVEGRGVEIDLSDMPDGIHAVQWYGSEGHIERQGAPNEPIESLTDFLPWLKRYADKVREEDAQVPPDAPSCPQQVTRFQAQAALYITGYLGQITDYMALDTTDFLVKLAWNTVLHFDRQSAMVASVGALTGLTDSQIDDLFKFAATIP